MTPTKLENSPSPTGIGNGVVTKVIVFFLCAMVWLVLLPQGRALADPVVFDGVVAVVGDQPILLSEFRQRAAPFVLKLRQEVTDPAKRRTAERDLARDLLDRLIDDALVTQAADQIYVTVTTKEVDDVLDRIAQQNQLSVPAVLEEARKSGLSEDAYRAELQRQVLEAKMVQRYLAQKNISLTGLDPTVYGVRFEQERKAWLGELRREAHIEIRLKIQ